VSLRLQLERRVGQGADDRARKTWLARNAAKERRRRSVAELASREEDGKALESVIGVRMREKKATVGADGKARTEYVSVPAETRLGDVRVTDLLFDADAIRAFLPPEVDVSLDSALDRLLQVEDASERSLGCRSSVDGSLITSPLVCIAEAAVEAIRQAHTPGIAW
jgi:hypothetical protein